MPLIPALLGILIVVLIMWAINQFVTNAQLCKVLNVFFIVIIVILMLYIIYDLLPSSWLTWEPHRRGLLL